MPNSAYQKGVNDAEECKPISFGIFCFRDNPNGLEEWLKGWCSHRMNLMRLWISTATPEELRIARAAINGRLSRRTITKEQQEKMQVARRTKEKLT